MHIYKKIDAGGGWKKSRGKKPELYFNTIGQKALKLNCIYFWVNT